MNVRSLSHVPGQSRLIASLVLLVAAAFFLVAGDARAANGGASADVPAKATVKIKLKGLDGRRAKIMSRVVVEGSLKPFRNLQKVKVYLYRDGSDSPPAPRRSTRPARTTEPSAASSTSGRGTATG